LPFAAWGQFHNSLVAVVVDEHEHVFDHVYVDVFVLEDVLVAVLSLAS
jgi:hypothetical protein